MSTDSHKHDSVRREILRTASLAGLTVCSASLASLLSSCEQTEQLPGPTGKLVEFDLDTQPILSVPGTAVVISIPGVNHGNPVVVSRVDINEFVVFSAVCTHQGCIVGSSVNWDDLVCPCHGARYSPIDGKVLGMPIGGGTATDLTSYPVSYDTDRRVLLIKA